jgi:hypothetical protein
MRWQPVENQLREGLRLDEEKGRTAGRKIGRTKARENFILMKKCRRSKERVGHQNGDRIHNGARRMALHPRAEVNSRMLMPIVVRGTKLMMEFKGRQERRKGQEAQPENRDEQICGETAFHQITLRKD